MKVDVSCSWCGKTILRYPSQLKVTSNSYCSSACRSMHLSKKHNPNGYTKHAHLGEYNRKMNRFRMSDEVKEKLRNIRFKSGKSRGYLKWHGRHLHRIVAERILGRPLLPGEVVHHIDHDKQNNRPENLMVFSSQAEHVRYHASHDKGGDAV